jgi:hypothetical protein
VVLQCDQRLTEIEIRWYGEFLFNRLVSYGELRRPFGIFENAWVLIFTWATRTHVN